MVEDLGKNEYKEMEYQDLYRYQRKNLKTFHTHRGERNKKYQ